MRVEVIGKDTAPAPPNQLDHAGLLTKKIQMTVCRDEEGAEHRFRTPFFRGRDLMPVGQWFEIEEHKGHSIQSFRRVQVN